MSFLPFYCNDGYLEEHIAPREEETMKSPNSRWVMERSKRSHFCSRFEKHYHRFGVIDLSVTIVDKQHELEIRF